MNDTPGRHGAPQPAGPDPLDDTQRVDVPRYAPAPDPRPDARWAWASPGNQGAGERWYDPSTGATGTGYGTASGWGQPPVGPGIPPAPAYGTPVAPVQPVKGRRGAERRHGRRAPRCCPR